MKAVLTAVLGLWASLKRFLLMLLEAYASFKAPSIGHEASLESDESQVLLFRQLSAELTCKSPSVWKTSQAQQFD